MASLSSDRNGNRTVRFFDGSRRRRKVCLGKTSDKIAKEIRARVKELNASAIAGIAVDTDTSIWLRDRCGEWLYDKLAGAGLVPEREAIKAETLIGFIDAYLAKRTDVKPRTLINLRMARGDLLKFFGESRTLDSINEGDADDFRAWMCGTRKLSENTTRRRCGMARQLFKAAVKRKLIASNPFGAMKEITVKANKKRLYFVTRDEAEAVIKACPDAEWRLLFALSRFGGLRCPSEHLALRWCDVNWEQSCFTVHSTKTEHCDGDGIRVVPIFPELREHFDAAWDEAEEGAEFVITRYRDANANLRTQMNRIIGKAGLKPWPKLFQNLRSTRQTELAEQFPIHVVCEWIGNSESVARKHYLQVTKDHLAKAIGSPAAKPKKKQGPESGPLPGASGRNERMEQRDDSRFHREIAKSPISHVVVNTPDRIRTCDLRFRKSA